MILVFQLLAFFIFSTLIFYFPGKYSLKKLDIKLSKLESVVISTILGIFIFVLLSLAARFFQFSFFVPVSLSILFALFSLKNEFHRFSIKWIFKRNLNHSQLILGLIILIGVVTQGWIHFTSAIQNQDGITFLDQPFRDAAFHLSFVGEFKNHFPPQHPLFAGSSFKNYHFLSDFLLAGINSTLPIPLMDLYFRILPIYVSLFYGLAVYIVSSKLTNKLWIRNIAVFLSYFAGPFSYLIPLVREGTWDANSFMLNQPFDFSFNTQSTFSLIIFLCGVFLILEYDKRKNKSLAFLAGIIFAISFTFKSYVSILGISALFITAVYMLIVKRETLFTKVFLVSILIFSASYLAIIDNIKSGLNFAPGWTLKKMVEDPDRLYLPNLTLREQHYLSKKNFARIAQINLEEVVVYTLGNLGIRTIGFIYLLLLLKKLFSLNSSMVFIIVSSFAGLLYPIVFNQGASPYDITQFGVYPLILVSIFSAIALGRLFKLLGILKRPFVFWILIITIITLSIPANIKTFLDRLRYKHFLVSQNEIGVLNFLNTQTPKDSVVLLYPSGINGYYAYVPAFAQRRVFISVPLVNLPYKERREEVLDFFQQYTLDRQREFINKNSISYVYMTENDLSSLGEKVNKMPIQLIIKTNHASLYKTI